MKKFSACKRGECVTALWPREDDGIFTIICIEMLI